jgi:Co/Zn/Cd efflux system component
MSHHHDHGHEHHHASKLRKPHIKWTAIIVVVLMLVAMLAYVFTDDDSLVPGQPQQPPTPAAP